MIEQKGSVVDETLFSLEHQLAVHRRRRIRGVVVYLKLGLLLLGQFKYQIVELLAKFSCHIVLNSHLLFAR